MNIREFIRDNNPYYRTPQDGNYRFGTFIPREDYDLILQACPVEGALQTVVNIALKALADYVRTHTSTYNPSIYVDFVTEFRRLTAGITPANASGSDDAGGAQSLRGDAASSTPVEQPPLSRGRVAKRSKRD